MWTSRREAIRLGALGVLLPAAAPRGPVPPAFSVPLAVPPVLRPVRRTATADHYRMTARPATVRILPGLSTRTLCYEGAFPGPTIQARAGRSVEITQVNGLDRETSVHLHGGHVPTAD